MRQTDPHLAELRRKHGSVWIVTHVIEGFDDPFVEYIGSRFSKDVAVTLSRTKLALSLQVSYKFIHLQSIVREG